jgi:hypothetical protein
MPLHTHVYFSTIYNNQAVETARCSTTNEWIKKKWYLYTTEFYSATKKNEILSYASKCMELENIISCSPSYADYRPKKCSNIMEHVSHTKGRTHMGGIGKGKET